jgi:hypothetical protein
MLLTNTYLARLCTKHGTGNFTRQLCNQSDNLILVIVTLLESEYMNVAQYG